MQTRCPFIECSKISEIGDEQEFQFIICPDCGREFSARSLARHLEIDKQVAKHRSAGTHADSYFGNTVSSSQKDFVSILEEIRSLWNVGSVFRSSDGAGFSHLFLVGITGCPPRKEIAKTSLGAEDYVGWNYTGNAVEVIRELKKLNYQILGLEKTQESKPLTEVIASGCLRKPLCLVVGSETKGIYQETLAECDIVADLPMRGFKESLNVAVAFGIASYAIAEYFDRTACLDGK